MSNPYQEGSPEWLLYEIFGSIEEEAEGDES
ncbi:hypothetical protein SEA_FUSHIGI_72 [Mycobacterium phage Fushigi]|uniref:Uncharacterized protein n=1 Tax=Mycobacterium phage KSSJEB TaxID=2922216 RepID=G1D720_9CAUD|nr:hypothetical protein FGG25_gp76 [Mycobacterium phage KSSJEB]AEK10568.1 hypothetical protein PBI_KSSJEB_76 [Mycobacterium phage KSSJEB]AXH67710.1 hypothetical protein SEA_ARLO_79 [Mycobacterium phage Arlo]QAY05720.1 hypothetical protein SEA_FUSHIGI_72 [Mycobacterium phage Fushigi]